MPKKGKKEKRGNSSDDELKKEVIGVESESESNSERDTRRKEKKSTKKKVRMRKVRFDDKEKKEREVPERVDELTKKLLQLNVKNDMYAAAYAQLFILALTMTKNLLPPACFVVSTVALTSTAVTLSHPRYSSAPMPHNFTCHFCKKLECCLRTCPTAEEYVQLRQVLRQPNGYYTHMDGFPIDAHHPGGLKGAIDVKLNIRDLLPHLFNTAPALARFSLFVKVVQEECHKLHLVISPPILRRFPRSQSQLKALKKTFRSIPVMSQGNQ